MPRRYATAALKPLQGLMKLVERGDVTLFFDQIQVYMIQSSYLARLGIDQVRFGTLSDSCKTMRCEKVH